MPIAYTVENSGHFVHAIASGTVTREEFVAYEVAHAIDERIAPPVSELLEIQPGSLNQVTQEDISRVLERRKMTKKLPTPHRCAIVVTSWADRHAWNLAKFYEGMVTLHGAEDVIVFGSVGTAGAWLNIRESAVHEFPESD